MLGEIVVATVGSREGRRVGSGVLSACTFKIALLASANTIAITSTLGKRNILCDRLFDYYSSYSTYSSSSKERNVEKTENRNLELLQTNNQNTISPAT